eukprot:340513-Pelagomonas_calceolata.AAC.1
MLACDPVAYLWHCGQGWGLVGRCCAQLCLIELRLGGPAGGLHDRAGTPQVLAKVRMVEPL